MCLSPSGRRLAAYNEVSIEIMALSHRFSEALAYTAVLHAEQRRKSSGEPYLAHLLAVAASVMEHGGNENEAIAALLHDAVEDQGGRATLDEIARRFGRPVAEIVEGCSDTMESPKPPWQQRKESHLAHLRNASSSVLLVTAADKLHNARSILREYRRHGESLWSHFRGGRDGTLWYYHAVLDILTQSEKTPLVEELARTVAEIELLAANK
jgi:(p)ppGpp synthase/HD superfamily hydrolase